MFLFSNILFEKCINIMRTFKAQKELYEFKRLAFAIKILYSFYFCDLTNINFETQISIKLLFNL